MMISYEETHMPKFSFLSLVISEENIFIEAKMRETKRTIKNMKTCV